MYNVKNEDYKFIYSPRTSLYNQKLAEEKLYSELAKSFDPYTVKIIKRHFKEHFGFLDRDSFIGILKEHLLTWYPDLPNRENILIKLLIRLFNEIDLDSDHNLTWDEFSNFIIHVSNSKKLEYSIYNLQQYLLSKDTFEFFENKSKGHTQNKNDMSYFSNIVNIVNYCFYINKLKCVGICYEGDNKIIFYNTINLKKYDFIIDLLLIQNEIDEYEINELEEKTEEMLKEQAEKIEKLLIKKSDVVNMRSEISKNNKANRNEKEKIINNNNNENKKEKINFQYNKLLKRVIHIINTCYIEKYDLLFISTTNNKISAWKYNNKFSLFNNVNLISSNKTDFIFQNEIMKIPIFSTELPQYCMCFDVSSNHLYSGQKDGKIMKWEMNSLKPIEILDKDINDKTNISKNKINLPIIMNKYQRISETSYNNNENEDNNNELNKKIKLTEERKRESVSCLLILEGLRLLCSGYLTGELILWDTITRKPKKIYNDQQTGIYNVIFDTKKNYLYTCGFEHDIFIYDPYSNNKAVYKLKGHNGSVNSISLNPNINELVSIDILGIIKVWDTNKLICFQTINVNERILLEKNHVKNEDELFILFSSHKKKNLSSNIYIEALPYVNKLFVYGDKFCLYEKGDTSNPLLTDSCMILGCIYNKYLYNIITFSSKSIKFWNVFTGKLEKVYNDLMVISEVTAYALDEEFKKIYLGDSSGKIKSFYLSSGEFLNEYESHKDEISLIFSVKKYEFLITCSKDLCIKFHQLNEGNKVLNEVYPCQENGSLFLEKNLLSNISLNEEKGLMLISLTNGWIVDYDIEHFKFYSNLNPNYSESIRNIRVSNVLDIKNLDIIFVSLENGDKYFLLKECNKYFNRYDISKFGNFLENKINNDESVDDKDKDNNNNKNIVICSFYCHEEKKLFTGDHLGFISCYDLSNISEAFNQNYDKNEIKNKLANININLIFKKQSHKESITFIDIPFDLKPKVIFTISTDRTVHLIDYYNGQYIDSLKVISIKNEPIPVAIKYYKQNPFISNKKHKLKINNNELSKENLLKKEKEEEKEIISYIKRYYENKLNKGEKPPINVIYRHFLEQNKKAKKPKISYDEKDNNDKINTINYAYDLINYEIKRKFNNKLYNNLLPFRSTNWNYNIDVNDMVTDGIHNLEKIKEKINNLKEEIRETEKHFETVSINNKNYFPEYIKNLKKEEKEQINEIIYNKINAFNLAVTRRNTMKKEIKIILSKTEKKKELNNNKDNNISNSMSKRDNNRLTNRSNKFNDHKKPVLILNKDDTGNNNDSPKKIKTINNSYSKNRNARNGINNISLKRSNEEDNYNYLNMNLNKYKLVKKNKLKSINLSKDFTDKRFLGYKNEFDEKYNEFKRPFEFLLKRNNKNYSKLANKLSFINFNANNFKTEL